MPKAQILVVQGFLCVNSSEKAPYYREKGPGVHEEGGQNTDTAFLALRLGVVLYLPIALREIKLGEPPTPLFCSATIVFWRFVG